MQNKKRKIALIGYGKMGKTIEQLAIAGGHEVILKVGSENLGDFTKENLRKADVAIEFSNPENALDNIRRCLETHIPVVSGTTGWLEKMPEIQEICTHKEGAFFYASNFSIGVNIFFEINRRLAQIMDRFPQYDILVEEIHHTEKLDAPSGTAITLIEDILEVIGRKKKWTNELEGEKEVLPIISKRVGKVPGTHEVSYTSTIDNLTIRHEAYSREGFAKGALMAAEWLIGRKGCFGMSDMLRN